MPSLTLLPVDIFRSLILLIPSVILCYLFSHKQLETKRWVGALFAYLWQFQWRMVLFCGGVKLNLWMFDTDQMLLFSVPADIMLGASLLLGALASFIDHKASPVKTMILLCVLDLGLILLFVPLVDLSGSSLLYLVLISAIVIVPSQLLAHWTVQSKHIYLRSILQNVIWAMTLLWLLPSILFSLTTDSWNTFLTRGWITNCLYLTVMLLPATLIIDALYRFAKDGNGTGFPYDAPTRLVTTGVYRYISNPMQAGIVLMMALWGMVLSSSLLILTAPIALVLFIVFKNVCNGSCQVVGSDPNWITYQNNTPKWLPFKFRKRSCY